MGSALDRVAEAVSAYAYRYCSEKELQDGIGTALRLHDVAYEREVRLGPGDVVDFMAEAVALEVKIDGSPASILRQLARYATSERVAALLLVTRKPQHAHLFPGELSGKPLRVVTLEASAL